jgi:hypothetical protein
VFYPSSSSGDVVIVADDDKTFTFQNAYSGRTNFFENRPIDPCIPRTQTEAPNSQPASSGKSDSK